MGHVQDFKSGGNLVAHIHVGTTYHSRKEVRTLWVLDIFKSLSSFRQCPHFEHFISMVRPAVRTNLSRIRSSSKALFKPEEFEKAGFRFRVNGKNFENEAFRKPWCYDNHVFSLTELSSSTNLKWLVIVMFLNFSGIVWTKNIWRALNTLCHLPWCIAGKQLNRGPRNSHFYSKPWLERKSVSIVLFIVGIRSCLSVFQLYSFSSSAFAIFWNTPLGLVVISFGYYLLRRTSQDTARTRTESLPSFFVVGTRFE